MTLTVETLPGLLTVIGLGLLVGFAAALPLAWWNDRHQPSTEQMVSLGLGVHRLPSLGRWLESRRAR